MASFNVIHVLTGCTAVGKTETALAWAEANHAEILSCDSLLFYRGMNIGTAKPTVQELGRVPHHLIDICSPDAAMDIARYVMMAQEVIRDLAARHCPVLVVGGSGFYLKAFFAPVVDAVHVPPDMRQRVGAMTLAQAVSELNRLNPDGLGQLDQANPRRVTRALERCLASGRTLRDLQVDFATQPAPFAGYEIKLVELARPPDELEQRIRMRVIQMIEAGLIAEVEHLLPLGMGNNPSAAGAIGYREVQAMLEGKLPREALVDEIVKNTRSLVKKQRTWFRTQLPSHRQMPAAGVAIDQLFAGS
ncbi:MAG: tRNA (adenosine(37)-N6)-dimethylallyltransferase MiaA [Cephaloticoccus sp.]|nr:tRNA (adenosine(37)-N6)-dimethylallyltransferase MiaA [Cephaloticoccus sp.]MCF7759307.1 tRNA (adenosine(37)-N6)-dimethylallyltransferase MiaA [Cephaloticoccus sp.]